MKLVNAGRSRWKIENQGFNRHKRWQGDIEHACSWNEKAQKNHYLLEQISDFIKQLYEYFFLKKNERTKSFACKTLARPRYCAAINSISAVCASSRSVFYVIGNCIAISYYIKKAQKNISSELLASFGRQLTETEDIQSQLNRSALD